MRNVTVDRDDFLEKVTANRERTVRCSKKPWRATAASSSGSCSSGSPI
jgi:hypothetical protein